MSHNRQKYIKISPSKARKLLINGNNILLIDVRTPEEYYFGHIPGSINIPVQVLGWEIYNLPISRAIPIMVYCKSGIRAASAASLLIEAGFETVYTLGGIQDWPYEIVR